MKPFSSTYIHGEERKGSLGWLLTKAIIFFLMPYPSSYVSWDGISSQGCCWIWQEWVTSYKTLWRDIWTQVGLVLKSVMFTASVLSAGKLHPKSLQHSLVCSNHCYLMVRIRIKVKGEGGTHATLHLSLPMWVCGSPPEITQPPLS